MARELPGPLQLNEHLGQLERHGRIPGVELFRLAQVRHGLGKLLRL
jgi:hypothetical protein